MGKESESLSKYISVLYKYLNYYINHKVKKFNIDKLQVEILTEIYHNEGVNQNELGSILMLDKITITKRLKGLVDQGYVKKECSYKDKRAKTLYVTDKGKSIIGDLKEILQETAEMVSKNLSIEDELLLRNLLQKMSDNMYQELVDNRELTMDKKKVLK
ncbi:MarR family winged helix-turn-helix transcriptional regulator [Natranaerobius trueperi]|uniref:HTH-type transcriptional regulator MgrA n=1 Tax=Natranaerobius trueperi TaxID=759412 RepID=A0A226BZC0_9FIRM|nr:MarR family transcriptional regulator [Natranaerobius trueperi]OWZ84398.1 hypothetical protein CDO51_03805 [Natranaerobius trueperi]